MRFVAFALFVLLASSCATAPAPVAAGGDGATLETAIVIDERSEGAGVRAEYAWLSRHFPNYERKSQAVLDQDGRMYDRIDIRTADGADRTIYFDITGFFGRL